MNSTLTNNKGVALVTALMFTLITLGIAMVLLYFIMQSIKVSSATKTYHNVSEATYGGGELMAFDLIDKAWKNYSSATGLSNSLATQYGNIDLAVTASNNCLKQKLNSPVSNWSSCNADQKSTELAKIKNNPDLTFLLKSSTAGQKYKIYAKIVDTTAGNTDTAGSSLIAATDKSVGGAGGESGDSLLSGSGAVYVKSGTGGATVAVQHIPYSYRLEVQGEKETNTAEKSNVTVLYAY